MNEQKVGDFIVDAKLAVQFRLTSNFTALEDEKFTSKFFGPTYMHLVRVNKVKAILYRFLGMRKESVDMRA
jgi:hypothetical protein